MTRPLERAARAAQEADGAYRHESGQWMKEGGLVTDSHWNDIARAVLEAIREPSEGMEQAMIDITGDTHFLRADGTTYSQVDVFKAMIDAALSEGG